MGNPVSRPATRREIRKLLELIDPNRNTRQDWRIFIAFIAFFVAGAVWILVNGILLITIPNYPQRLSDILVQITPLIMFITMCVCYYSMLNWTPKFLILRSRYGRDYLDGQVMVYHYTATSALFLVEYRTERSYGFVKLLKDSFVNQYHQEGFYLDIGGGKLLFLTGSYLTQSLNNDSFPCTEFDIIRLPHADETLDIDCLGSPLDPQQMQLLSNVRWADLPQDLSEVTGSLEAVASGITHNS